MAAGEWRTARRRHAPSGIQRATLKWEDPRPQPRINEERGGVAGLSPTLSPLPPAAVASALARVYNSSRATVEMETPRGISDLRVPGPCRLSPSADENLFIAGAGIGRGMIRPQPGVVKEDQFRGMVCKPRR